MMTNVKKNEIRFAFFGTSHVAAYVLDELERAGLHPNLIVTPEDKPQGRGMEMQPSDVSRWAQLRNLSYAHDWSEFEKRTWDVAIVVDYGVILPKRLLEIPKRGFLNVHPSLLPRFRGPSPMRSAILKDERETGVTVMLVDEQMDHGPIVAQKKVIPGDWPLKNSELERLLLREGGTLLSHILPTWVAGDIEAQPQNDDIATYCEKFSKEDGELDLKSDPYANLLKIRAFEGWPGTYAFFARNEKKLRVQIIDAHMENGKLVIDIVKPEGKGVMPYDAFANSGAVPL